MTLRLFSPQGPVQRPGGPTTATIGVFDGVHLGHRHLLRQLGAHPPLLPMPVVLSTHPVFLFGKREREEWIVDPDEQLRLLFEAGAKLVAVLHFDREAAALTACQMATRLFEQLDMRHLLVGYDSRFGSRVADDFALLPQLARRLGFGLETGQPLEVEGSPVSSSRIRRCLAEGRIDEANALLGYSYTLRGPVVHGRGVGHTLGFPTANVSLAASRKLPPMQGVYAVRLDGLPAVANLGGQPTFGLQVPTLEVHIPNYCADLYGREVGVEFLRFLRPVQQFASTDALRAQLQADINHCLHV